jgi:ribose-phosphate pyrophosphokinase
LCCPVAAAAKHRPRPDEASTLGILGDVEDRNCILVDDMVSTGHTLIGAAKALQKAGARRINAVFTHAVMSAETVEHVVQAPLERIVTTDTIPLKPHAKINIVSMIPHLADRLMRLVDSEC